MGGAYIDTSLLCKGKIYTHGPPTFEDALPTTGMWFLEGCLVGSAGLGLKKVPHPSFRGIVLPYFSEFEEMPHSEASIHLLAQFCDVLTGGSSESLGRDFSPLLLPKEGMKSIFYH